MKAVLTYHSIDDSGSPISVGADTFNTHLQWLTSGRVRVLSLGDLAAHPESAGDAVAVTFDDGFLNVRDSVERLLGSSIPATIFVVTGCVGGTNDWEGRPAPGIPTLPLLDWTDLERLVSVGVTVEAHTRTHRPLTRLSLDELDAELAGSRDELQSRLGTRSTQLAYPYGDVDDAVAERASRHYGRGYTTDFRAMSRTDEPMRLPRLDMYYFRRVGAIEAWGSGAFARRVAWVRMRRRLKTKLLRS